MQEPLKLVTTPSPKPAPPLAVQAIPANFAPSQEQIEALARRLMHDCIIVMLNID